MWKGRVLVYVFSVFFTNSVAKRAGSGIRLHRFVSRLGLCVSVTSPIKWGNKSVLLPVL